MLSDPPLPRFNIARSVSTLGILIVTAATCLTPFTDGQAAVLANYTFGTVASNSSASVAADPNAAISSISAGAGVNLVSSGVWGNPAPSGAMQNANAANSAGAITGNDYWTFTLTPSSGYQANLTSLTLDYSGNSTDSPTTLFIRSSIDNFGSDLISVSNIRSFVSPVYNSLVLDLSGAAFQDLTSPITFRLYAFGAVTTASVRIDNVILNGSLTTVPEPSAVILMMLGGMVLLSRRKTRGAVKV